jgi:hypothetical protein
MLELICCECYAAIRKESERLLPRLGAGQSRSRPLSQADSSVLT